MGGLGGGGLSLESAVGPKVPGTGDIEEAEVDAELSAVVDHVVEEHTAVGLVAGRCAYDCAFAGQGEGLVPGGVWVGFGGVDEAADEGVVLGEELVAVVDMRRILRGSSGICMSMPGESEHEVGEAGELGGVAGEAGEGHGLRVGREVVLAVRDGGEDIVGSWRSSALVVRGRGAWMTVPCVGHENLG